MTVLNGFCDILKGNIIFFRWQNRPDGTVKSVWIKKPEKEENEGKGS